MKKKVICIAVSACLFALLTATAFAQLTTSPVRANIPFSFTVRGRTLPAGEYEVSRVNDDGNTLQITNIDHRHQHAIVETEGVKGSRQHRSELVFHRYGDSYFLYEVWTAGFETGSEVPTSSQEKILKHESNIAGMSAEPQTVAIAIN